MEYFVARNLSREGWVLYHEVLQTAPHQIEFVQSTGLLSHACCVLTPCLAFCASVVPH